MNNSHERLSIVNIRVNGKDITVEKGVTILSLLQSRGINPSFVVVEYNYEIPGREKWGSIMLEEGDNIEIVKFIGGG